MVLKYVSPRLVASRAEAGALDSTTVMELAELPKSMIVIGAGVYAAACEGGIAAQTRSRK
ncbi:MAG: hypothetical protein KY464_15450 [Gemmatimonadetes bacterium]|nr:hypothetical protein [Gemmatimonadota bacterium]